MPKSRVRKQKPPRPRGGRGPSVVPARAAGWEERLYSLLLRDVVPAELLPLYAVLVLLTHRVTMENAATCVPTCATLAAVLNDLGMAAEPIAAKADLHHLGPAGIQDLIETVGSDHPLLRGDGTTNGHMVVYVRSLRRLVDPTIVQAHYLRRRTRHEPAAMMPAIVQIPGDTGDDMFYQQRYAAVRDGYAIVYTLQPDRTADLLTMISSNRIAVLKGPARTTAEAVTQNTAEMTATALDLIKTAAEARGITNEVLAAHPQLAYRLRS